MSKSKILPLLTLIVAIVFIVVGLTSYGFWDSIKGPTGGFFPIIVSVVLFILSVVLLVKKPTDKEVVHFPIDDLAVIVAALSIIIMAYLIGMIPAILVYLFAWTKFVQKESLKTALIMVLSVGGTLAFVFGVWFATPFPEPLIMKLFGV